MVGGEAKGANAGPLHVPVVDLDPGVVDVEPVVSVVLGADVRHGVIG